MGEDQAGWMHELGPRDAALVRAFRNAAVALGHDCDDHGAQARAELATLTTPDGQRETVHHFWALMTTIGTRAERQIRFHAPDCPCLGEDEVVFLQVCERLRAGKRSEAARLAERLVPRDAARQLVYHATVVAGCCRGRPTPTATPAGPPAGARLH